MVREMAWCWSACAESPSISLLDNTAKRQGELPSTPEYLFKCVGVELGGWRKGTNEHREGRGNLRVVISTAHCQTFHSGIYVLTLVSVETSTDVDSFTSDNHNALP